MNDPRPNTTLFPYKNVISKTTKLNLIGSQKKICLKIFVGIKKKKLAPNKLKFTTSGGNQNLPTIQKNKKENRTPDNMNQMIKTDPELKNFKSYKVFHIIKVKWQHRRYIFKKRPRYNF